MCGHRQNSTAAALGFHRSECLGRLIQTELGHGQHRQFTIDDSAQDLRQLLIALRTAAQIDLEVDDRERGAGGQSGQPRRRIGGDVLHAKFDETTAGGKELHAAPDRLAGR